MKTKKRIEKWLADERFRRYAEKRMQEEITEVPENHTLDRKYEELDEGFECDDRYISPLVEYLAYRLHLARLCRNPHKRRRDIWWVFVHVFMQGHYTHVFSEHFDPLLDELQDCIIPMLHEEYVRKSDTEKGDGQWS